MSGQKASDSATFEVAPPTVTDRSLRLVMLSTATASFMTAFGNTSTTVALPAIASEFHLTVTQVQWVTTAYFLISVSWLLSCGNLADRIGRKRVYLAGSAVYGLGVLLSSLAPTLPLLVAARLVQGFGTALVVSTNFAVLVLAFPPERLGRAVGVVASIIMIGNFLGPGITGLLLEWISWRGVFGINILMALVTFLFGRGALPADRITAPSTAFDWPGALLQASGMAALVWGISQIQVGSGIAWIGGGLAMIAVFVSVELKQPSPLMHMALFRRLDFSSGVLGQGLHYLGISCIQFALPFFLIRTMGFTNAQMGAMMTIPAISSGLTAAPGGWLSDRYGGTAVSTGSLLLAAVGYAWLALRLPLGGSPIEVAAGLFLIGAGGGLFMVSNRVQVNNSLPSHYLGEGNALHATARHTGILIGTALAAGIAMAPSGELRILPVLIAGCAAVSVNIILSLAGRRSYVHADTRQR